MKLTRALWVPLIPIVLSACAGFGSRAPTYDPDASESIAKIVSKREVAKVNRPMGGGIPVVVPVPIGRAMIFVRLSGGGLFGSASIPIFEYVVEAQDGNRVQILSEFFAYEVGNCVKLFLSDKPTYPRIAPWSCH